MGDPDRVPLDELEDLLLELPDDSDEAMLLSELDGYLAGLLVSPHPVAQEEWLKPIWGGGAEAFPGDPERSDRLVSLVLARKTEIAVALLQGGLAYQPVFDVFEHTGEVMWPLWAEGFGRAMALSGKDWDCLLETGDEDLGAAALGLVMYVAMAKGVPTNDAAEAEADEQAPDVIPYLVETLYRRQRGLERVVMTDDLPPPQPAVSSKVGRNEPCPCGSGKKYKKCCGG
ncbi:MAG TPA: UPF0149 family protein [Allosphingosinicella sp.]|nr:UPF0149 family protein [Allosphingosinicella sp.]